MSATWPEVRLGEVLRYVARPVAVSPDQTYREIGIRSHNKGIFHKESVTGLQIGDKRVFWVTPGDFVLNIVFAWEGAVAIVGPDEEGMIGSHRFPTFHGDPARLDPRFLVAYLRTPPGIALLDRVSPGGAGRNRTLSRTAFLEQPIPLPPVAEQRRIVEKIEDLATKVAEACELRQQVFLQTEALCRSLLAHDPNPQPVPMRELVRLRPPDVSVRPDESYQFAGVYSFGRGVFQACAKMGMEFAYSRLTTLRAGNLVYPKLMAWEGALGVVPSVCDGCVVSTEFPVFEVDVARVLPEVLDTHFRTPSVWPVLSGTSTGTNVRRRRLNPKDFLNYQMPLPSREIQERLRVIRAKMESMDALRVGAAADHNVLLPAILDRAFKGEL